LASPVLANGESFSAGADPLIYVNPSFEDAADYSIPQSPGVANATTSTPEPGALILICGCGLHRGNISKPRGCAC
jgi:hypothetical protein